MHTKGGSDVHGQPSHSQRELDLVRLEQENRLKPEEQTCRVHQMGRSNDARGIRRSRWTRRGLPAEKRGDNGGNNEHLIGVDDAADVLVAQIVKVAAAEFDKQAKRHKGQ